MNGDFEVKSVEAKPALKRKPKQPGEFKEGLSQTIWGRVKSLTLYLLMAAVLVAAGFATYFWYQASALRKNPQKAAQQETQRLLANVGQLIVLPDGESPTIATVTDPERLRDQPFFAKSQTGDKVLIYTNARKAILYNPRTNKIVEVAPINIGQPQTSQ